MHPARGEQPPAAFLASQALTCLLHPQSLAVVSKATNTMTLHSWSLTLHSCRKNGSPRFCSVKTKEISSDDKQSAGSHCFECPSQERMENK